MNTETKHTALHTMTPWIVDNVKTDGGLNITYVATATDEQISPIAKVTSHNASANAAFIVRACNTHDELVAALEDAYQALSEEMGFYQSTTAIKIRAALRKAKGEVS